MEKIIYALWRDGGTERAAFNRTLLDAAARLSAAVRGLRINLQDDTVQGGTSPRLTMTDPQMEAVVQLWVDSAGAATREPIERDLATVASRIEGWLVCEATEIANWSVAPGTPTDGFSQIVFLPRPRTMPYDAWRSNWQDRHTPVAIATQSNFEYVQNLVVRPLTDGAGDYAAIVEECFPLAALANEALYFDAPDDPERQARHQDEMMASCARFMDERGCDCIPTRQYELKRI